jgi:hypothetical protein
MPYLFSFIIRVLAIRKRVKKSFVILAAASCVTVQSTFFAAAQAPTQASVAPAVAAPAAQQDSQRTIVIILVKNALLAVNQGNLTGNYTVLRDLASPGFREKNSAADLAAIFQNIRQQKIDMSPIVAIEPMLNQPRVAADGQVAIDGFFEAQQMRITFQLIFLKAPTNGWMIHGVSLNAVPLPAAVATTTGASLQAPVTRQ